MTQLEKAGVELVAEGESQFLGAMDKAEKSVKGFADATEGASGKVNVAQAAITGAFTAIAGVAVEAFGRAADAVGNFVGGAIEIAAEFEQGQNVLQAASGATEAQMKQLGDTAIALGNDLSLPATSAVNASEAMTELVKAGLSVDDTMKAAKGTLQLAAAAQIDEAEAAAINAQALNTFHLEGSQAVVVADMLAAGANASSASITDLSQGLQQAGFAFEANNQDADDLITALAQLTNVGLSGSDAGTALKNAMIKLAAPTKEGAAAMEALGINVFDAEGKMKPFRDVIGIFNKQLAGMTDEQRNATLQTILQSDGMKAFIPILDAGVAGFDAMNAKVNEQGAAAKMAGAQTQGFKGAQMALQSQLETLQLVIGTALLPVLNDLFTNVISPAINTVMNLVTAFFAVGGGADQLSAALAPVIEVIRTVITAFQNAGTQSSAAFTIIQTVVQSVAGYVQAVLGTLAAFMAKHGDEIQAFIQGAWEKIGKIIGLAVQLISAIVTKVFNFVADFIEKHGDKILKFLEAAWNAIRIVIDTALKVIESIIKIALAIIQGDWDTVWTEIRNLADTVWKAIISLINAALELIKSAIDLALAFITSLFEDAWNRMIAAAERDWNAFRQTIENAMNGVRTAADNVVKDVIRFFEQLPGRLAQIGAQAIQNLVDSLLAGLKPIRDAIQSILDAIANIRIPNPFGGSSASNFGGSSVRAAPTTGQTFARLPGSGNTTNMARNFNLTLNTAQASAGIISDFAIMEALAG